MSPGWEPQPLASLIPAGLAVLFVGCAWLCDAATAALVNATGTGEATHYLPRALGLLAVLAALAVTVFLWTNARTRRAAEVTVSAPHTVTVTVEALNIPKSLPAHPAATYPMPHLIDVIDAEIVP